MTPTTRTTIHHALGATMWALLGANAITATTTTGTTALAAATATAFTGYALGRRAT